MKRSVFLGTTPCITVALAIAAAPAAVMAYPTKPIRVLVGFPAGGSTDVLTRQIGVKLADRLGQQIIVDNRPGATGNLAAEIVAKGTPDGHTLMMATVASHGINPALFRAMPYDAVRDFQPVTLVATYPLLLAINAGTGIRDVRQLIEAAKTKPGALRVASSGNGSPGHLSAEVFMATANVELIHVPYKGGAPATISVLGGETQLMFATLPGMMPHVKAGRVIAAAVTTGKRSPALPDVPTVAEAGGLTGFDISSWAGVVGPARMPRHVVQRLHREIVGVITSPDLRDRLAAEGAEPVGNTPEAFAAFIKSELAMWSKAVKQAGAQLN